MLYMELDGIDEVGARWMECSLMGNAVVAVSAGSRGALEVAEVKFEACLSKVKYHTRRTAFCYAKINEVYAALNILGAHDFLIINYR